MKGIETRIISDKNQLQPDSVGVFSCEKCGVIGQFPQDVIGRLATKQIAEQHANHFNHIVEIAINNEQIIGGTLNPQNSDSLLLKSFSFVFED